MAFSLTDNAEQLLQKNQITPQMVLQIDGVDTLYGAVEVKEFWKVGDPGLDIGDAGLLINGQVAIADQESLISFSGGTSNRISQTLNVDRGTNESISSLTVALLDKSLKATELITPGHTVPDLLGLRCKIWFGESGGSWKDDYFIVFRAVITEIDAASGIIKLGLASPDTLKKSTAFLAADTELTGAMDASQVFADVTSTASFVQPFANNDGSLEYIIRIDDELMKYEAVTATQFGTLTRGYLGTTAATHESGNEATSFYRLQGNALDLALNFMLSDQKDPYLDQFDVTSFVAVPGLGSIANAVFFAQVALIREYNVQIGDKITTTGATAGANNVTDAVVTGVFETSTGSYIVLGAEALVSEDPTSALIDFNSKFDVWGPGAGLGLRPEEVDILQHETIRDSFLQTAPMDIYLKEEIESGKTFIAEQLYNPVSAYSIPRKAQSSVGYHIGPIPGIQMITLNAQTVTNASELKIKRTINKNFFNTIVWKFDEDPLEDDFRRGLVEINSDSLARIKVGNNSLTIEAKGLRTLNSAVNIAQLASERRLRKYKFAAEQISNVKVKLGDGLTVEVGDKLIVDMKDLKLSDIQSSTRDGSPRIFEVVNKTLGVKSDVSFDVVDTNFDLSSRFSLIGPCSRITQGNSTTEFIIESTFTAPFGTQEFKKWVDYVGTDVTIRNEDWTVVGTAKLQLASSNTITVTPALAFTPGAGYFMELGDYDTQTADVKLVYGFQSDGANNFADDGIPYQMS